MSCSRLSVVLVLLVGVVLAARVDPARACSCAPPDPRHTLPIMDGAFVGRLLSRRAAGDGVLLTFRVERVVKGEIGETIEVRSFANGSLCGVEGSIGDRIGLMVAQTAAGWEGNLCSQVDPEDLVAAARPLPRPDGRGAATLIVGGRFGGARLIALDRSWRTLAYGRGQGTAARIALCPGGNRVVEAVGLVDGWLFAVRERRTLRLVRTAPLRIRPGTVVTQIVCTDALGSSAVVYSTSMQNGWWSEVRRVGASGTTALWRGHARAAVLTREHAYLATGAQGTSLVRLNLATGRRTALGRLPTSARTLSLSPDETHLAGITYDWPQRPSSRSRAFVADLRQRPVRPPTTELLRINIDGDLVWLPGGRLAVHQSSESEGIRVYDRRLRLRARLQGWSGRGLALVGDALVGLRSDGVLMRVPLTGGPARALRKLPSASAYALLVLG